MPKARKKKKSKIAPRRPGKSAKSPKSAPKAPGKVRDILVRHIAPENRRIIGEEAITAMTASMAALAQTRKPGEMRVRVFNPTPRADGYASSHTVIMAVNDDMPFLVDSVAAELGRLGLGVHLLLHPVVFAARDTKGQLVSAASVRGKEDLTPESWMYIEVDETPDAPALESIAANIRHVLHYVSLAVGDWRAMQKKIIEAMAGLPCNETIGLPPGEREESASFLSWLESEHFTFLGMRDYRVTGSGKAMRLEQMPETALGILREKMSVMFFTGEVEGAQPSDMHRFLQRKQLVLVTKTYRVSPVHRAAPMDAILIKQYDAKGRPTGERLFIGLFTSASYRKPPRLVPLIRGKIDYVVNRAGLDPRGHDGKTLVHVLNNYPRDELFQISREELFDTAMGILDLQQRQRLALFARADPFGRFVSCLIFTPRDQYDTRVRQRFQDILMKTFNGVSLDYKVSISDDPMAQVFIVVRIRAGQLPAFDRAAVERALQEAGRSWNHRLQDNLVATLGENRGLGLARRYAQAFPDAYSDSISAAQAVSDITFIEDVLKTGGVAVNLFRPENGGPDRLNLKWFVAGAAPSLAHVMPLMRHMGLEPDAVLGPFEVRPAEARESVWVQDYQARLPALRKSDFDLARVKTKFEEGLLRVWNGEAENDPFNALILSAGLHCREVVVLRAIGKYLRQVGFHHSGSSIVSCLSAHPRAARLLVALFLARHDPGLTEAARKRKSAAAGKELSAYLETVERAEDDLILRRYQDVLRNMLRTNYFQTTKTGPKPYLSFKLDSQKLAELPLPRPMVEIYVYSPRMEGIHLRGGKVARGGIRWSDRPEDFRTEILGLMKSQMVKNTVIVPVGSKGGFVVKNPAAGPEEGVFCYRRLISGMLDITDNRKGEKIIPPKRVVRHDGNDPYLVVAADKGTTTFSDIANALSQEYGFWLGDAFASGGSAGYDHKDMGITARGAWEAVKRHFRERGKDIQKTPFTVAGVGDMAGDVFGNAMLLSEKIRLLAAFNHTHIFIDPDPDPAVSFAERRRLFRLPGSKWSDYTRKALSKGGGVYARDAKSIRLFREARALFGLSADDIAPNALIRAILKMKVELLWFGGIGTFVKAADESHADAGDRANDPVRVDAGELQAPVIGEGANLGVTQRARIAFARKGGRVNTDAIDNSAGVDTSDYEVNIKILLDAVMQEGKLSLPDRNKLLANMTGDVARHVLRDNYMQTLALTVAQSRAAELLPLHARLITQLERAGQLNRAVEGLPDDEEIQERLRVGGGLSRPEMAVLMGYAKISLYNELIDSPLPDDAGREGDLFRYFPPVLQKSYAGTIRRHRLRREIIATFNTNSVVNRGGLHFILMMREKTGKGVLEIVRAYAITRDVLNLRVLWRALEKLDNVTSAGIQAELFVRVGRTLERTVEWYLTHATLNEAEHLAHKHRAAADRLRPWLEKDKALMGEQALARRVAFLEAGAPEKLVDEVLLLPVLAHVPDITAIAGAGACSLESAADLYFTIEKRFCLRWLRGRAQSIAAESHWQREAVSRLQGDLYGIQVELTRRVLGAAPAGKTGKKASACSMPGLVEEWVARKGPAIAAYDALLAEIAAAPRLDFAMFTLALGHLHAMIKP